jgi:hypothetical protein
VLTMMPMELLGNQEDMHEMLTIPSTPQLSHIAQKRLYNRYKKAFKHTPKHKGFLAA